MKKLLLLFSATLFTIHAWGQNYITTTSNNPGSIEISHEGTFKIENIALTGVYSQYSKQSGFTHRRLTLNTSEGDKAYIYYYDPSGQSFHTMNIGGTHSLSSGLTVLSDGKVGIGISNPSHKLNISNGINQEVTFRLGENNVTDFTTSTDGTLTINSDVNGSDGKMYLNARSLNHIALDGLGNVGIGTITPTAKLTAYLNESGKAIALLGENKDIEFHIGHATGTSYGFYWRYVGTRFGNLNDLELWSQNLEGDDKLIYQIHQDGNLKFGQKVGIGCEGGTNNYALAVKGIIGCGEVIVENVTGWADFVFEDDYNLMPLQELDSYIQENKHLPEIPTTEEVKENGISVGEMNAKLLQKIEELTLYIIEQDKKIETQNKRIEQLEKK